MTDLWTLAVIVALAGVTVLTRGFFLFSGRPSSLPRWAERGLQYAPIAALAAVIAPEVVLTQGELIRSIDARVLGALAGGLTFLWHRSVFGTILAGMTVYLPLHIGLGW
jgi:branched-subunit amino acid transport protein